MSLFQGLSIMVWETRVPAGLSPFILMEYVAHVSNLAAQLRAPGYGRGDRPFLDPDIEEEKLEFFYAQVANILLELSRPSFDKFGALAKNANGHSGGDWCIKNHPLIMNINELVQLGDSPPSLLPPPDSPFEIGSSY